MKYAGLYRNTNPINQPEGTSPFMMGCEVDRLTGTIISEKGNEFIDAIPSDRLYISHATIEEKIILCLCDVTGQDNFIGVIENDSYLEKYSGEFGYTTSSKVRIIPFYASSGDLVCILNDGENPPRIINLDNDSYSFESTRLFPELRVPDFDLIEVGNSGNLMSGAYYISIAYMIGDYVTNDIYLSRPIIISSISENSAYSASACKVESVRTNRSITFRFTGLDKAFDYAQISVIKQINGITSAVSLPKLRINKSDLSTLTYTYTGFENVQDRLVEEILIDTSYFETVGDIVLANNTLVACAPSIISIDDETLQRVANAITVKPVVSRVGLETVEGSHKDSKTIFINPTFMPGEVIALYLTPILNNGQRYKAFHIPGRVHSGDEKDLVTSELGEIKKYKVFDTSSMTVTPGSTGGYRVDMTMGYWENENETYPQDFPDFAGENVRHHRLPSLRTMSFISTTSNFIPQNSDSLKLYSRGYSSNFDSSVTNYGTITGSSTRVTRAYDTFTANQDVTIHLDYNYDVYFLKAGSLFESNSITFNVDIKVIRSNGQTQTIEFYEYYKAQKSKLNKQFSNQNKISVNLLAGDKLQVRVLVKASRWATTIVAGYFDFKLNVFELSSTGFLSGAVLGIRLDNIVIPDEIKDKIQGYEIGYARRNEKTMIAQSEIFPENWYVDPGDGSYTYEISDYFRMHPFESLVDKRLPGATYLRIEYYADQERYDSSNYSNTASAASAEVKKVEDLKLVPGNNTASLPKNKDKEEYLRGKLTSGLANTKIPMATLCAKVDNMYLPYTNQQIVSGGKIFTPDQTSSGDLYIGDCYVNMYGVRMTYGTEDSESQNSNPHQLNRNERFLYFPVYSSYNIGLRASGSEWYETFYPLSGNNWDSIIPEDLEPAPSKLDYGNYYGYNKDYSATQHLKSGFPSDRKVETQFPYRIIKGLPVSRESDYNLLRRFLAADYYEAPKDKGPMVRLDVWADKVIIHRKQSMYITVDKARMLTEGVDLVKSVTLGTGDLFEFEPDEVIPTVKGYAGLQDINAALMTPAGYVFCDENDIYLYDGNRLMNINMGLKEEFIHGISSPVLGFNPFNDHIYLTFTHYTGNRITASFIPALGFWASFHPYKPSFYINTKEKFYSLYDNKLYLHNHGAEGVFYGQRYDSIIDIVFNPEPNTDKILEYVSMVVSPYLYSFDKYALWTQTQHTGIIDIVPKTDLYGVYNAFRDKDKWFINDFVDKVKDPSNPIIQGWDENFYPVSSNIDLNLPWYDKEQIISKYFIFRLISNNTTAFQLHDISFLASSYQR